MTRLRARRARPHRVALVVAAVAGATLLAARVVPLGPHEVPVARSTLPEILREFLDEMPRPPNGRYRAPTQAQASTAGRAFALLRGGDTAGASAAARSVGMVVATIDSQDSGERFDVLREPPGRAPRGWGLFVHRRAGESKVVVEAVHPLSDLRTVLAATALFERAHAADLLIAGAHRRAAPEAGSDVAHADLSVLQEVHRTTVSAGRVIVQAHGFHPDDGAAQPFGDAVVSSGTWRPTDLARAAARALESAGVLACLVDGERCAEYAARTNVQGRQARKVGAAFLHVELSPDSRRSRRLTAVVTALASVLPPSSVEPRRTSGHRPPS